MLQESVERRLFTRRRERSSSAKKGSEEPDENEATATTGATDSDGNGGGYWFPAYEDYCVANAPETALSLLANSFDHPLPATVFDGVETAGVDTVVLFLLDGFGYEHWKRDHRKHEFTSALTDRGTVTPLTSIYPSETAAAITTLQTGRLPVEHGLLGWFQYIESAERVIQTLPFVTPGGDPLEEVAPESDARELFDGESLYSRAADAGVESYAIQPEAYVDSGYTRATTAGAERIGYDGASELAATIRRTCESAGSTPTYVYAYEPTVDAVSHAEGTDSERYQTELGAITEQLQRELVAELEPAVAERTLLLVTADHGIVDTVPSENIDVSDWDDWPAIREAFRRDEHGDPRLPTGGPRNVHLHVQPDQVAAVSERIERRLDARTFTREEALDRGLFGPGTPSSLFERRCGDLIVVHRNRGISWPLPGADGSEEGEQIGLHGGLTREEMLVPLAAARLDSLRE